MMSCAASLSDHSLTVLFYDVQKYITFFPFMYSEPIIIVEAPEENIIIDPYDVQTILNFTVVATSDISEKLTFK